MSTVPLATFNEMQIVWAVIALSGIGAAVLISIAWFVKNILRSKSGKTIDAVKAQHKQLLVTATPSHRANMFRVFPMIPGVLQTTKFENRVKNNRKVFYEAELTPVALKVSDLTNAEDLPEEEQKKRLALTQECLDFVVQGNTQKLFLEDSVPLTLAIEDKVITCGVKGLGAMAFLEKLYKINALSEKIARLKKSDSFKDVAEYLQNLASQITPIDIDLLRSYFNSDWDQSDDEAQKELYYTMGFRDGRQKDKSGLEKTILFAGIAIGIMGLVGGAVLGYLGSGGG